jgi:hypothetical protein
VCRADSKLSGVFFLLTLLPLSHAVAQRSDLVYQSRGKYSEGIRATPSTGPTLDLVAALVDYQEKLPSSPLPPSFRAMFYLPDTRPLFLTIREINPRYYYWLGDLLPTGWQTLQSNRFAWPTNEVIRSLNWDDGGPLSLSDLGAIARLGNETPSELEVVAPVALYYSHAPESIDGYRFVFQPSRQMRLQFQVFPSESSKALETQAVATVLANAPYAVTLKTGKWADGWYRLVGTGHAVSNDAVVNIEVRFYHYARLGR